MNYSIDNCYKIVNFFFFIFNLNWSFELITMF